LPTFLNHALALIARGFAVFPLQPRSKEPYPGSRGFSDATTDAAQITAWWTAAPDSNIGLRPPVDVVVVDPDPRHGGLLSLARLAAEGKELPDTLTVRTGRGDGGLHAYYRVPTGLAWPKEVAPGIDLKPHFSYLVAPPSIHPDSGFAYEWLDDVPISDAPAWLVALGTAQSERALVEVIDEDSAVADAETIERIAATVAPHFAHGKMHHIALNLSGWMKQRGYGLADAEAVVRRLPCRNLENGLKAVRYAYRIEKPFGWSELQGLIGAEAAEAVSAVTPNPRRERELAGLEAVKALIPNLGAAPATIGGLVGSTPSSSTMLDRLRALKNQGPAHATGLEPLDKALRGGLRPEKVVVVGGAPGAGKTSLARQVADHMVRNGVAVGWLASDEEPSAVDVRRLQAIGVPREVAEQPGDAVLERAERELAPLPFEVFDSGDGWTLERVFVELARRYPDAPRCVVADSLQTVTTERTATLDSLRAKIDDVIKTAKQLARLPATRAMVLFTCELSRGSYRNEASAEATDDLAAFKESGGIEYGAHLAMVLRSFKGDGNFVQVTMPKNRLGPKIDFNLKMDRETTNLEQTFEDPREEALKVQAELAIPEVRKALEDKGWPGLSGRGVELAVRRDAHTVRLALRLMAARGLATMNDGPRNAILWTLGTGAPVPMTFAPPEPSK
jgi:hypothetical protein